MTRGARAGASVSAQADRSRTNIDTAATFGWSSATPRSAPFQRANTASARVRRFSPPPPPAFSRTGADLAIRLPNRTRGPTRTQCVGLSASP